ncbi:bactofilin family protein [Peristeroidobacter soli]|jgi:cytoskeletal protein CcmA (bactofilin family)|uniref:bactofilin family protein n=1 Tax=Peristeroidobacter soli TaxID=2497877 RepID=UPI00101D3AA4|nr:polymer-forming cytoskeletal protein [Peristeroidobacter soli]
MRSFGFDQQRQDSGGDTVRVPSLSSMPVSQSSQPPSPSAEAPSKESASPERKIAVLGPTLRFKGELSAEEDFILQGRIEGSINHTQSVTIGTDGAVVGNIHARVVVIDGSVEGDLHGSESVTVHETGRVTGNIFAPRVGLVDGAVFNGRIDMSGAGAGQSVSPSAKKRVESPTITPGQPLSAEETEKVLGSK